MNYYSTRSKDTKCSSAEAIKEGLSADGGLFVPEGFPKLSLDDINQLVSVGYNQRAVNILSRFLTDFTEQEVTACVNAAYNKNTFDNEKITPVYKLNDNTCVLELWHGLTCAFKDVALQILPHLLTYSIEKTNDERTAIILVATSGDTGKAALEGFKNVKGTKIAVFYPQNGVSNIQKLQMTSQEGDNVMVSGINGNFDDAQNGVKRIFTDEQFKKDMNDKGYMLSSANSINWGRLVPQIVYYFSSYCDMLSSGDITLGEKVNFVVPTGNFGDILAGYYAKCLGLPVNKLICASNKNNVLTDFINTGVYNRNREFYTTASPSMDILISSNLERFLYDVSGKDCEKIKIWMAELSQNGVYEVDSQTKQKMDDILWGGYCNDEGTKISIKKTFDKFNYIMDTHTAVGMDVYKQYVKSTGDNSKTLVLSTASPYKFCESVLSALKGEEARFDGNEFELLDELKKITGLKIPNSLAELKNKQIRFEKSIEKDDMKEFVKAL